MTDTAQRIAGLDAARLAVLSRRLQSMAAGPRDVIARRPAGEEAPLSSAQERLWFLNQMAPGSAAYHIATAAHLEGRLDVRSLERALAEVIRRHEILRTAFPASAGQPHAIVKVAKPLRLPCIDLVTTGAARARDLMERAARRPFDLAHGPLVRASLFRLSPRHHVLCLVLHHIVADGWSLGVMARELSTLYAAFREGRESPLSEPVLQYADFAGWQREMARTPAISAQLDFWRRTLDDVEPMLDLPADRPGPPVQSDEGGREPFVLDAGMPGAVRALAARERVTPFSVLLAGFAVLLWRYTGQKRIAIGTGVAGRNRPELEAVIGSFVNTLVLRAAVDGRQPFRELVQRVHEDNVRALSHQDVPFDAVLGALRPERSLAVTPLFQVEFVLQNVPRPSLHLPELRLTFENIDTGTAKSALTVDVEEGADTMGGVFEYSADLFEAPTVRRMVAHWKMLLAGAVANPAARVDDLPLLTPREHDCLVREWNGGAADMPAGACLHDLISNAAAHSPDALAVASSGERLTFGQLERRANRLARHLRRAGVGPEQRIGLCLDRSVDLLVATLAVLKSGAAYVPLDPMFPEERLAFMIRDAGVRLVVARPEALGHAIAAEGVRVVHPASAEVAGESGEPLGRTCDPQNLAYVMYTSGSSGVPKGVQVAHRALVAYARDAVRRFGLQPRDRVLQFAALGFDVVAEEVFPAWLAGACVVLETRARLASPLDLADAIDELRVTMIELPTSFWHEWVYRLESRGRPLPGSLRLVLIGGEPASNESLAAWRRFGVPLMNVYGLTEAAITTTTYAVPRAPDPAGLEEQRLPIGRPIAGSQVYVLDAGGRLAPPGSIGEMHVAGAGLARGYINRPDSTADRFRPCPFGPEAGARLYRTGDLGRHRADGTLEYVGRADDQTNIRGFRVDPHEVASLLRRHPSVRDAAVMAVEPEDARGPDRDRDALADLLTRCDASLAGRLLDDVERSEPWERPPSATPRRHVRRRSEFEIVLTLHDPGFIKPPKEAQQAFLLRRALDEFSDDLMHLDRAAGRMVPGSARPPLHDDWPTSHATYEPAQLTIQGQQVMQDWERPLMKAMAAIAAETHGDVLEVGFGLGISATYLQELGVRSHTIVEPNQDVLRRLHSWKQNYPDRDIRVIPGRWQDVVARLGAYDAVFFDTIPVTEGEYVDQVATDVVMAEELFPVAADRLRPGGVFTWYTNEIDTFSRRHQRLAFRYFTSITLSVVRGLRPPEDCQYWWADSMVAVRAVK